MVGMAVIIAARLSSAAEAGQILLAPRAAEAVEGQVLIEPVGELQLKGFSRPMAVVNVLGLPDDALVGLPAELVDGGTVAIAEVS